MTYEELMNARARQWQNRGLYQTLNEASGLPPMNMPEPIMTAETSPSDKRSNKTLWMLLLAVVAFLLFGKAFTKGGKKR